MSEEDTGQDHQPENVLYNGPPPAGYYGHNSKGRPSSYIDGNGVVYPILRLVKPSS